MTNESDKSDKSNEQPVEADQPYIWCLGTCMTKCDDCQHHQRWLALENLPTVVRLSIQNNGIRVSTDGCQITNGRFYAPPPFKDPSDPNHPANTENKK